MKTTAHELGAVRQGAKDESWLEVVRRQVGSLSFGIVQIVVHESRMVQIEHTEKLRLANPVALSTEGR